MDWINNLEKEKQAEQQRQAQTKAAELKQKSEESERFRIIRDKLCPVIESTISELKKRTGFQLQMSVGDTSLVVRAPHPQPKKFKRDGEWWESYGRISDHRIEISDVSDDGKTVCVKAIKAGETNRNPNDQPEDMSYADYFGTDETVMDTHNDIDMLVSEDVQLLLEWLVRLEFKDKDIVPPEISGVRQRKEQRKGAFLKAYGGLAVGIVALFLIFAHPIFTLLGPFSIYLGLHARRELSSLGITYDGHGSAKWAIGLGVFESGMLVVTVLKSLSAFR